MALGVGIIGLGFMGKMHFDIYAKLRGVRVAAICDVDIKKLQGDWGGIGGNISGGSGKVDLHAINMVAEVKELLADPNVEVVDITLPTPLHAKIAAQAFKAGKHVICEKPMARTPADCKKMLAAATAARRKLFISHCIRFWPEYAKARALIKSGRYGKVRSATFTRLSPTPRWSFGNWAQDPKASGACALDMHIHDTDFILHTFGKPKSVMSRGSGFAKGRLDHIVTLYEYPGNCVISAEGGWDYPPDFPFSMTFRVTMEKASLVFGAEGLWLYGEKGKGKAVKVMSGDGYYHELKHFVACIAKNRASEVISPREAMQSLQLVEQEMKSAQTGKPVTVRF